MMEATRTIVPKVKHKFGFATPQEATWTCEKCGEVQPRYLSAIDRYMRAMCVCQRAEIERQRAEEEMQKKRAEAEARIRYTYGWLGSRWSDEALAQKSFTNFEVLRQIKAYEATLAFADIMEGCLILYGSYGTGKTHLLAALCQEMTKRGRSCRFTTAPKLFSAIQFCIGRNEEYTHLIQKAIEAPFLVLDDVDKAKWTEFREEVYFEIIDSRVNAGRPLALSTNRLDDLESYVGGACASRLSIGRIAIEMVGDDYRREM